MKYYIFYNFWKIRRGQLNEEYGIYRKFSQCKILQVDNETEFKNKIIEDYCEDNNIKLIHSSSYQPKINGGSS